MRRGNHSHKEGGGRFIGFILILAGLFWLLHRMKIEIIPSWLISGPVLMIALGLVFAIKTRFQKVAPLVITLLGLLWLNRKYDFIPFEYQYYLMPIAVMIIGIVFLLRPKKKWHEKRGWSNNDEYSCGRSQEMTDSSDKLVIDAVFCGSKKRVTSHNFQGGTINVVFGGSEINLSQADFEKEAELEISVTFGGLNLIIPSNWEVNMQLSTIAAGVEDNRPSSGLQVVPEKTLTLKGSVVFGGVEIQSH